MFDELADKLGLDPLELRLKNALQNGQPTVTGQRPIQYSGKYSVLVPITNLPAGIMIVAGSNGWRSVLACVSLDDTDIVFSSY